MPTYNGRMVQHVDAVYENGVLKPLAKLDLPECALVHVSVSDARPAIQEPANGELSLAQFDSMLDELATDGVSIPGTFSRADIYADHD